MRKLSIIAIALAVITTPSLADPPLPTQTQKEVTFRARNKFTQQTSRLLKIFVDADAMPLDSDTLTTITNSSAIAGRAAKEVFGLSEDRYGAYIEIEVKASKSARSITARMDMTFRADQRIPERYFEQFTLKMRDYLRTAIAETVKLDQEQLALVKAQMLSRRKLVETEMAEARSKRIEMTVKAGLAEIGYTDARSLVAAYMKLKQEYEIELVAKRARLDKMKEHVAKKGSAEEPDPWDDPTVKQLQKLVELNEKRLEKQMNSKYATPEDIERTQAALIDATIRVTERVEAIEEKAPQRQLELLEYDVAELQAKANYCQTVLTDSKAMARDMYVSEEDIVLIREKETRLRTRLAKYDEQIANFEDTADKLQFVTVTVLGYATSDPKHSAE